MTLQAASNHPVPFEMPLQAEQLGIALKTVHTTQAFQAIFSVGGS